MESKMRWMEECNARERTGKGGNQRENRKGKKRDEKMKVK